MCLQEPVDSGASLNPFDVLTDGPLMPPVDRNSVFKLIMEVLLLENFKVQQCDLTLTMSGCKQALISRLFEGPDIEQKEVVTSKKF